MRLRVSNTSFLCCFKTTGCRADRDGVGFSIPFTMAFQPIFDIQTETVFAYEALVRPIGGGSAKDILSQVHENNRYSFGQQCRKKAISLAAKLGMKPRLGINFMPNAVYDPEHCIRATLWAAKTHKFPIEKIIFEFVETEEVRNTAHLQISSIAINAWALAQQLTILGRAIRG